MNEYSLESFIVAISFYFNNEIRIHYKNNVLFLKNGQLHELEIFYLIQSSILPNLEILNAVMIDGMKNSRRNSDWLNSIRDNPL